jgi:hypothetical protein
VEALSAVLSGVLPSTSVATPDSVAIVPSRIDASVVTEGAAEFELDEHPYMAPPSDEMEAAPRENLSVLENLEKALFMTTPCHTFSKARAATRGESCVRSGKATRRRRGSSENKAAGTGRMQ